MSSATTTPLGQYSLAQSAAPPGQYSSAQPTPLPGLEQHALLAAPPGQHSSAQPTPLPGLEQHALLAAPPGQYSSAQSAAPPGQWDILGYFKEHSSDVIDLLLRHIWLAAVPVVIGLLISLPIGYVARRYAWTYPPLVSIAGLLYTVPSLALFVLAPGLLGTRILDPVNVLLPLTLYTVALLVRVVADGLASVPNDVLQSATAMGYGRFARLLRVELPIAVPVISAGLRVAAVSSVGLVTVATTIGTAQLGQLFSTGLQMSAYRAFYAPILLGIVLCLLLALVFDLIIVLGTRAMTPWRRVGRPS